MKKILLLAALVSFFACKNEPKTPADVPTTYEDIDQVIAPKGVEKVLPTTPAKPQQIAPTHEAITNESISLPEENDACIDAVLAIAKSSIRIQETMKMIEKEQHVPAFIVLKNDEKAGVYNIKLGVSMELRFDTWTNFTYFAKEENLTEQDIVSGENEPIDFDLKVSDKLPKNCF